MKLYSSLHSQPNHILLKETPKVNAKSYFGTFYHPPSTHDPSGPGLGWGVWGTFLRCGIERGAKTSVVNINNILIWYFCKNKNECQKIYDEQKGKILKTGSILLIFSSDLGSNMAQHGTVIDQHLKCWYSAHGEYLCIHLCFLRYCLTGLPWWSSG